MSLTTFSPVNVLFTSAGRRVELIAAFRQAYTTLGLTGRIVALDIDALAPAAQVADRFYLVPRYNDPAYIPTLIDICRREAIDLIFPLIDPDIVLIAQNRAALEATGAKLAVVPEASAQITRDKWLTNGFFKRIGVPVPQSWLPEHLSDADLPAFPLFIKPRFGSSSVNTFKVNNARELDFFKDYVPHPIIQEFLPGDEITNDVICDLDSTFLGVISRKRLQVRGGEISRGVTVFDAHIAEYCRQMALALPAVGPITAQCITKDGRAYFTEINARLGGGVPLSIAAGADFPAWLLARFSGIPYTIPPLGSYKVPLYLTRFDDAFYLTLEDRERLESQRVRVE